MLSQYQGKQRGSRNGSLGLPLITHMAEQVSSGISDPYRTLLCHYFHGPADNMMLGCSPGVLQHGFCCYDHLLSQCQS